MATITEDYVSFEIAKLLKEKGFNERLLTFYITDEAKEEGCFQIMAFTDDKINNNYSNYCYLAPTLQMVMKWLREMHNIHIVIKVVIRTYGDTKYYYELYGTKNKSFCVVCDIYKGETWDSNEKAVEEAIKYCLENLI